MWTWLFLKINIRSLLVTSKEEGSVACEAQAHRRVLGTASNIVGKRWLVGVKSSSVSEQLQSIDLSCI